MAKPKLPANFDTLPTEERIKYHYQHGQGSIQDIARSYRYSVDEVLRIIDQEDLMTVQLAGDQIDQEEAGVIKIDSVGKVERANFTTD